MKTKEETPLQAALEFRRAGIFPLRVKEDGSKAPAGGAWKHRAALPDEEDIHKEFSDAQGIGILPGKRSGNLEMLEFEGRACAEGVWTDVEQRMGVAKLGTLWMRLVTGYKEHSPSGGVHLLYYLADGVVGGNKRLASRAANVNELTEKEHAVNARRREAGQPDKVFTRPLIETRGEGGYVVTAPSGGPVHKSGNAWVLAGGGIKSIPTISAKDRAKLWAICQATDRAPRAKLSRSVRAGAPETEWERSTGWEDILEPHGWELESVRADGVEQWRHAAASTDHSATVGNDGKGLYVFSTSTEFEEDRYYSKAEAYAVLNTGGNAEAAREELGLRERKPVVVVSGRDESELVDEIATIIAETNREEPVWFEYGNSYMEVNGSKGMQPITNRTVGYVASLAMRFASEGEDIAAPPMRVLEGMIEGRRLNLPRVRDVVGVPFFTPTGKLWATPGYCAEAEAYYVPEVAIGGIGAVGEKEAELARRVLLDKVFSGFPFVNDLSKSVVLAMLFQPFVRMMIQGPTPLYVFEAPAAGTGKTLLGEIPLTIAFGHAQVSPFPKHEHMGSTILTKLREGAGYTFFDNCHDINHEVLNAVLTAYPEYSDRLLGGNTSGAYPNLGIWLVSSNNPTLGREELRRSVRCRIDAKMEYPDQGREFWSDQYPGGVLGYVRDNRVTLIRAVLVLIQDWVNKGMPRGKERLGSFEEWSEVMGGVTGNLGLPSPAGGREELAKEKDAEGQAWKAFVEAWAGKIEGDVQSFIREAYLECKASVLLALAKDGELELPIHGHDDAAKAKSLGVALSKKVDSVIGGYFIRKRTLSGSTLYRIVKEIDPGKADHYGA